MRIHSHFSANNTNAELFPFPRELSMQAYLLENGELLSLEEDDLREVEVITSELHTICKVEESQKGQSQKGRIDLLAYYNDETLGVVELKNAELNIDNVNQLARYLSTESRRSIANFINDGNSNGEEVDATKIKFIGILVGTEISDELKIAIANGAFTIIKGVDIYAITIRRFRSDNDQVFIVSEIFGPGKKNNPKDYTKYSFNGKILCKSKLVLEVVRWYVNVLKNGNVTFGELSKVFKKEIQGSRNVFKKTEEAIKELDSDQHRRKRFYFDDPIQLSDCEIVVSNQWGSDNIGRFYELANYLGAKITVRSEGQSSNTSCEKLASPKTTQAIRKQPRKP